MPGEPTRAELEAAHCWEPDDRVPNSPEMTAFRRRVRYHQAQWRERHGHPVGSQPIRPKPGGAARTVGSRLPLDYAVDTAASFLTPAAAEAARNRTSTPEPHQSFDHQRFWADLLWSPTLAVNLFAELAVDPDRATAALGRWWNDTPGHMSEVRFSHSPGRLDPAYLTSLMHFDAAVVLDLGDGSHGIVGVVVRYHERAKAEQAKPERMARNRSVAGTSGAFACDAAEVCDRSELLVTWLQHLLLLSMLQHPSGRWRWGRLVVVHPTENIDMARVSARYRELLVDDSTFVSATLEELLVPGALSDPTRRLVSERYLPDA